MLDMLKGVADRGTAMRLRMGWGNRAKYGNIKNPTACKTGTTQNNSDGWFIGICLLYTSDAADERSSVDLRGRRIIKKKNN
mgnify:CR=1 FL=1